MKRFALILALPILLTGLMAGTARSQQEALTAAAKAYDALQYAQAAQMYEKLVEQAPYDPDLLYNLGTTYAQEGKRGLAIWRLSQALRLKPRDPDIRENLLFLDPHYFDQLALSPIPPINWVYLRFTANEWTAAAGGATLAALLIGALMFRLALGGGWRGRLKPLMWACALAALAAWPLAATHYYFEELTRRGIIVADKAVARTGPSDSQIETFSLPVGRVVEIQSSTPEGWLKISFAGGRTGFVKKDAVRFL